MRYRFIHKKFLLTWVCSLLSALTFAQYPGGVSSGTTRGFKVDYYNGTFTNVTTAFGAGTANATPGNTGYTNKVLGTEFYNTDNTNYGLEYTGILEITTAGTYTITMGSIDDQAALYIDGILVGTGQYSGGAGTSVSNIHLAAGDHVIKVKYRNGGGAASMWLRFTTTPAGSGITVPADIDGRFVKSESSVMTAWYKAANMNVTANYGGAGVDKANTWLNMAPAYSGNGGLAFSSGSSGYAQRSNTTQLNFNPGVRFDGDDLFRASNTQKGLSFRGATKSMFLVLNYTSNVAQANTWLFYHYSGAANESFGLQKVNSTSSATATNANQAPVTSTFYAGEPKLLSGFADQVTGGAAPQGTTPLSANANGTAGVPASFLSNVIASSAYGLNIGFTGYINEANIAEAIYYPFKLSQTEERKVNSYLAVKYGIRLSHDYVNTAGTVIFGLTPNAGYTSRIFGIGREDNQALYQKQSASRMKTIHDGTPGTGEDFLVISKGAIAATNQGNTGTLPDGSYTLLGDNTGALTLQGGEIPLQYTSACTVNRIGREWKAQVTGNPGPLTFRAGSGTVGSFLFPGNASGIKLVVDADGDGDFLTGASQRLYDPSSVTNGVATFENVTINNGEVITFAWTVTSPGGVSNGLSLWVKGEEGTSTTTSGTATTTWNDLSSALAGTGSATYINDGKNNFNPYLSFNGSSNHFSFPSGFNDFTVGLSSFFVSSFTNTSQNFSRFFDFGNGNGSNNIVFYKNGTSANTGLNGYNGASGSATITTVNPIESGINKIYSVTMPLGSPGNLVTSALNADGLSLTATGTTMVPGIVARANNYIGRSNWSGDSYFNGTMSEGIIYRRQLTAAEQLKVNSYLSVKYGRTLPVSLVNYVLSDGTVIWDNNTYWNSVFGIGRDDCSGLYQKQAQSTIGNDNVIIGLGSISTTNLSNSATLTTNKQFVMIGNDAGAFTGKTTDIPASYIGQSCNPYRYIRNWKVRNTGNVTNTFQFKIGNPANKIQSNWNNITLAVNASGDATFGGGTTTLYKATGVNNGVATFDNVLLPDGAVFTVLYTLGYPGGVKTPSTVAATIGGNPYINGLAYSSYTISASTSGRDLSVNPLGSLATDVKVGSGFADGGTFTNAAISGGGSTPMNYFGVNMIGKLRVTSAATTYRFRIIADDQGYFQLKNSGGTVVTTLLRTANGTSSSTSDITLAAGDYDLIFTGANNAGTGQFLLRWSNNSGGAYTDIPAANLLAPAPADGPGAWFQADNNLLASQADGTNMAGVIWPDLSAGKNDVTGFGNPIYYSATTSGTGYAGIRNYNPSIYFTSDYFSKTGYLNGFAYGKTGKTILTVATGNTTSGNNTSLFGYGIDATAGGAFILNKVNSGTNGTLQMFTQTYNLAESSPFYTAANANTTNLLSGNIDIAGNAFIYANGSQRATGSVLGFSTMPNDNAELQIGSAPDYSVNWDGNINEEIYYPWTLNVTERQKVNSYLAIKWGITIDQTTPTDYLSSSGSVIWNATDAASGSYKYAITGVGRDDCGALNQKQSHSYDDNDIVSISKGTLNVNNASNMGEFTADKTFLVWSHANQSLKTVNTLGMPAALTATACYVKIDRIWRSQTTGTPGPVSVAMGSATGLSLNRTTYKPVLLVTTVSSADFTSATIINSDSVKDGKAYFNNVDFGTDVVRYFTIAYIQAGPGGVRSSLTAWYDAGADVFTDDALTTYASADGDLAAGINNVAYGATLPSLLQSTTSKKPVYNPGKFNYNPSLYFDGVNDGLYSAADNISTTTYRANTTMTSIVAAANYGTTAAGQFVFWEHTAGGTKNAMELNQAYFQNSAAPFSRVPVVTVPELYSFRHTAGTGYNLYKNLLSVSSGVSNNSGSGTAPFTIGSYKTGTLYPGNFDMGEIVIYSDDKGTAATPEMRKIHSYLAVKYGYTLDAAAMGNQYISSGGVPIFNDATFWNRITGIGRDDCSAFEQKQSFSREATGALVKISNDAANGLAATNALNSAQFGTDQSYLLFGDNNKSIKWTGEEIVQNDMIRLNRVWRVKEVGAVNSVYLQVPSSASTDAFKLPATNTPSDPVYLLISKTGSFATPHAVIEMVPGGTDLSAVYNFEDGDYFTFATIKLCLAPAGITEGVTTWYKTTDLALGAIAVNTANALTDNGLSSISLNRNASGTATVTAGNAASFNYNRYVALTGNAAFTKGSLNESSLMGPANGTLFGVGTTAAALFNISSSAANRAGINGSAQFMTASGTALGGVAATANVYRMSVEGGATITSGTNGAVIAGASITATSLPTGSTYSIGFGTHVGSAVFNNGSIAEAFGFSRNLTAAEKEKLDTYLALKYGQTLAHNYYSPDYNGTNAASTTLYDVSTYGNRVLGVGNDVTGCFFQNQSSSALSGRMLKIGVDGALQTENSQDKTKWPNDRSYVVMGDNNAATTWTQGITSTQPALYGTEKCLYRIARQWKVQSTLTNPEILLTIPDQTSTEPTKLQTLPPDNSVYMVINDNPDFTVNANQMEVPMVLNATTKEWEAAVTFDAGVTKYITFVYRPENCGRDCILTNPATSTRRMK